MPTQAASKERAIFSFEVLIIELYKTKPSPGERAGIFLKPQKCYICFTGDSFVQLCM